jgi:hypothetical protein
MIARTPSARAASIIARLKPGGALMLPKPKSANGWTSPREPIVDNSSRTSHSILGAGKVGPGLRVFRLPSA